MIAQPPTPDDAEFWADIAEVVAKARKWDIVCEMAEWCYDSDLRYWAPSVKHEAEGRYRERHESAREAP